MIAPIAGLALLVSDRLVPRDLRSVLTLCGYRVENVYSAHAALAALRECDPALVVAGPFRSSTGVFTLLRRLHERDVRAVVVSRDPSVIAFAEQLGMTVRIPELADDAVPEIEHEVVAVAN